MTSLYQIADHEIRLCISEYLALAAASNGFASVSIEMIDTHRKAVILLAGIGASLEDTSPGNAVREWEKRTDNSLDIEKAITEGVYTNIRAAGTRYLEEVKIGTQNYRRWTSEFIQDNPHTLPILQHLSGTFSKAALKRTVGAVSDNHISRPAADRLAKLLEERVSPEEVRDGEILQRLEATLEGIVRDLIGRVMLESIVEGALREAKIPFRREDDYVTLPGVVYDHRADFIIPNESAPKAFIEVRKSSSRHASLYAKDKMFSAINWKGLYPEILAILVVDGEWTSQTLQTMAGVFDYVVPLRNVNDLAEVINEYLSGNTSKLKWVIDFTIRSAE